MTAHQDEQLDDSRIVERLRAVRTGDAPAVVGLPQRALAAGKRARRRRRVLAGATSGTALVGAAALAVVLAQGSSVAGGEVTMAPAGGGTQPATGSVDEVAVLASELGADFTLDDQHRVAVKAGSPSALGLPAGYAFVGTAWTAARGDNELASMCGPDAVEFFQPCANLLFGDDRRARVAWAKDPNAAGVSTDMRVAVRQADGDLIMAAASATGGPTARSGDAHAWLQGLAPRIAAALASPRMEEVPPERRALLAALGPDFALDENNDVRLVAGSATARRLPSGFRIWVSVATTPRGGPEEVRNSCGAFSGHGRSTPGCTSTTLPDGKVVQISWIRSTGEGLEPPGQTLRVVFLRPDGDVVVATAAASEDRAGSAAERLAAARQWLADLQPHLIAAATDPAGSPPAPDAAG